jgi:nucleoside-diphosphate-sugar epimerase
MVDRIKGKRVLVTGGAGFIGSHITHALLDLGAQVTVLDNLESGRMENLAAVKDKIRFVKGDIVNEADLDAAMVDVDCICHQAALRSVPKSVNDPMRYNEVNVSGTMKLFIKARDKGIKRVVMASSSSVFGDIDTFPEREDFLMKPISPYAATKAIGELNSAVFCAMYDMEIVNLRYFNVFGPRQSLEDEYAVVVPKFIHCHLKGQSAPIYDDGEQCRDFVYVGNVVDMNIRCLVAPADKVKGQAFNVGNGNPHTVNELFFTLKDIIGSTVMPTYLPKRKGDVRKTHADIAKALSAVGWTPKVTFREGLEKTVAYFKTVWA